MSGKVVKQVGLLLGAVAVFSPASAGAAAVGYQFEIDDSNPNAPFLTLDNTSSPGIGLVGFEFTIGDTGFNFDRATSEDDFGNNITRMLISPDDPDDNVRSDRLEYSFSGFDSGESFEVQVDIDEDNKNTVEDFRTIFYNNDGVPNSDITVTFSGGDVLTQTVPDNPDDLVFAQSGSITAVPSPGTLGLVGLGIVGLGAVIRRRRV
jgi:MYXO-CTERM domain-containing protein